MVTTVLFFRGVGDWSPAYGSDSENSILQTLVKDNPTLTAPFNLIPTTAHTVWDKREWFGWLMGAYRKRQFASVIQDELHRDKRSRSTDSPLNIGDGVKDVIDFLFRPGVAGDYAEVVLQLAIFYSRMIRYDRLEYDGPVEQMKYVVIGHSLGTVGAFLFCRYLMNCFTPAEWESFQLSQRVHLMLVSPALGFPSVRNKVARFIPKTYDPSVSIASARLLIGTKDFMLKIPSFDIHKYNQWTPSLLAKAHSLRWASNVGHTFSDLLAYDKGALWAL